MATIVYFRGRRYATISDFVQAVFPHGDTKLIANRVSRLRRTGQNVLAVTEEEVRGLSRPKISPSECGRLGRSAAEKLRPETLVVR